MIAHRNRLALLTTSAAGLVAVLVAWLAADAAGSALLGVAMVLVFFPAGALPFAVVGRSGENKGLAFLVLGMTYVLRILLGVVVYAVATTSDAVHPKAVGLTVIACALVWVNTQLVLGLRRRGQPTLEL